MCACATDNTTKTKLKQQPPHTTESLSSDDIVHTIFIIINVRMLCRDRLTVATIGSRTLNFQRVRTKS